jgi:hypothetical protein
MVITLLHQSTLKGQDQQSLPAEAGVPDAISTERLEQYKQQAAEGNSSTIDLSTLRRDSPMLYVLDNRIIPEQIGLHDKINSNLWLHPRDVANPAREPYLRDRLNTVYSIPYPAYPETEIRAPFISALRDVLKKDPALSDVSPPAQTLTTIDASPFNAPLSHIVNGKLIPQAPSPAEQDLDREANAIYLMLEYKLAKKYTNAQGITLGDADAGGYPNLLRDTINSWRVDGVTSPTIDQLIGSMHPALGKNLDTAEFVRTANEYGAQGIAELLNIDQALVDDIMGLMDYSKTRGFPLNDVINWEYGRASCPPSTPIADIIERGKQERINETIEAYRNTLADYGTVPNQLDNELLLAYGLDAVPPLVRELFFELNGQIIFTENQHLYNILKNNNIGSNLSYDTPEHSFQQIFISGNLGLPRTLSTIVHEMHHQLFPNNITPEEAIQSDILLNRDQVRINIFMDRIKDYQIAVARGDETRIAEIMQALDSPEYAVGGKTFSEILAGVDMDVFAQAVTEASHEIQLESPTFNRISTYQDPLYRYLEVIPRYADMRFVKYRENPQIMEFIAPNTTESYNNIYLPHLQRRLDELHSQHPSRADSLIYSLQNGSGASDTLYNSNPANLQPWEETLFGGDVQVTHPAGDSEPVSVAGWNTSHPFVQNYNIKKPASLQQTEQGAESPRIIINPSNASLLNKIVDSVEQYDLGAF